MKILRLVLACPIFLTISSVVAGSLPVSGQEAQPPQKHADPKAEYLNHLEEVKRRKKAAIERAREEVRQSPESHFALAEALAAATELIEDNDYTPIINEYNKSIQLQPDNPEALRGLARMYGLMRDFRQQVETLERAIRLRPLDAELYCDMGYAHLRSADSQAGEYRQRRERELAVEAFHYAARLKLDYGKAYEGMGSAFTVLGRVAEAIQAYSQAIRFDPNTPESHIGLGRAYVEMGDKEGAMREYEAVKRLGEAADADYVRQKICQVNSALLLETIKRKFETK